MGVNVVQPEADVLGVFVFHFHNGKCHRIADGEMFPIRMRKLDNISVRQTYRWKARFMGFLLMYSVSTSTSGLMGNYQNKNSESANIRNLTAPAATRAAHQLHTVLPLIHAPCDGIVLVQAAGFYYKKYGIYEYMSVAHCPQPELRFDYAYVP